MKRIEYFRLIANLFDTKILRDKSNTEYILIADSNVADAEYVEDHTEFEALQNHVHLLDHIKKDEFPQCVSIAKQLGRALLNHLCVQYPEKDFIVFATVDLHNSMTIRFHQKWPNEAPYYDPHDFDQERTIVLKFESCDTGDVLLSPSTPNR